jgi:hypothetical protein
VGLQVALGGNLDQDLVVDEVGDLVPRPTDDETARWSGFEGMRARIALANLSGSRSVSGPSLVQK